MAKYQIDYQPYWQRNPATGANDIRCPRIVNKRTLEGRALAEMLQSRNIGRSMSLDEFKGLIDAIIMGERQLALEGYKVGTGFTFVQLMMNGTLGANDSICDKTNTYLSITPRTDLKLNDADKFSYHNVEAVADVQVDYVATVGGNNGEWQKNKQANATGKNVQYDDKIGDIVTWKSGDLSGEVAVDATSQNVLTMAWDSEWDEFTAGTEITLTFTLHGGIAEATPKTITKTVKVVVG